MFGVDRDPNHLSVERPEFLDPVAVVKEMQLSFNIFIFITIIIIINIIIILCMYVCMYVYIFFEKEVYTYEYAVSSVGHTVHNLEESDMSTGGVQTGIEMTHRT
jgi:hypothetical protein